MIPNGMEDVFWRFVLEGGGCWNWRGIITRNGYGQLSHNWAKYYAHRVSWELNYGPIPDSLWVLHRCDNRPCVRPDHLFLGDSSVNTKDCWNKGRHPGNSGGYGKSGVRGVAWDKINCKWRAQIYRPVPIYLGLYGTVVQAQAALVAYRGGDK